MNSASEPIGTLEVALDHAARLLEREPSLALRQAEEILAAIPGHPYALLIAAVSHRHLGNVRAALDLLEPLAREQLGSAPTHFELALALDAMGRDAEAAAALRRALQLKPDHPAGWRLLADILDKLGDAASADHARARYLAAATRDPRLMDAAAALVANDLPRAEALLRNHLRQHETDVAALRMLAEVAARLRRYADAQVLLERCLELAPSFEGARHNYAVVLNRQGKAADALPHVDQLLGLHPRDPGYLNLKAAVLANLGEYRESIEVYERVLASHPQQPKIWLSYGHSLKTAGRQGDSIAAYRRAIAMQPSLGEAYWSLANLKTYRFSETDTAALRAALARADLTEEERLHFEFSLAKSLEDSKQYEQSFRYYLDANERRKRLQPYDAAETSAYVKRGKEHYAEAFFAARAEAGSPEADPIFIVGLPRAGSTLIEQILSSHSMVEGTMELPELPQIARDLVARGGGTTEAPFFEALAALTPDELSELGRRYLEATRAYRKTSAPRFVDKMPNNWLYVGLIRLILPNATIIDARRHPLGCCLSAFKQHFARGQNFSYDLGDLGHYYRDYVALMAHVDAVSPGRIHRVFYESMVEDTEAEVRRLLEHCGLPFEAATLRFYENERAVRTASSEQVRRPIFKEGMDQWRHFEPWLGPLETALGPVLDVYPAVPPTI